MKLRHRRRNGAAEVSDDLPALERIGALTAANRENPSPETERRLVRARHAAYAELDRASAAEGSPESMARMPESVSAALSDHGGLPEVEAEKLSAEVVRAAFLSHGSLIVRGLVEADRAGTLAAGLDRAFEARDAFIDGAPARKTLPWFEPFEPDPAYDFDGPKWNRMKKGGGSLWAPDSPRLLFAMLEEFERAGLPGLVADYLGERPAISHHKSVLRRVSPDTGADWHQDGAFLGEGIRTLNVWLALSSCGIDAPGMDIVQKRLGGIVETGTEGAIFPWSVSPQKVEELMDGEAPSRPAFEPGDAILFDHLCLHRTATEDSMTQDRYATETWCFAPSSYPPKQVPLVL